MVADDFGLKGDAMARDNEWSIYEAALLLDAYLNVRAGNIKRPLAVKDISCALRTMAENCGATIDAKYRSESGIHFQLLSIESAFEGRTLVKPASALFAKIVDLYRNSFEEYSAILQEARTMVDKPRSNTELFREWLAGNAPTLGFSAVLSDLAVAESYCTKKQLLKAPLLDTTDVGVVRRVLAAVESDKIFRITYKNRKNSIHKATALYYKYVKHLNAQNNNCDTSRPEHSSAAVANKGDLLLTNKTNSDPVLAYFEANNIEYIDQRGPVGGLWVIDDNPKIDAILNPLRAAGMIWVYTRDGGSVTNNRAAYWTKDSCSELQIESAADRTEHTEALNNQNGSVTIVQPSEIGETYGAVPSVLGVLGIVKILRQHYKYGFRYTSIRELIRFRRFAEEMNIPIPEDDEQLKATILSSGTMIDEKVYCKNDDIGDELRCLLSSVFETGAEVVYYECLFQREAGWMASHEMISEELLKEYLIRSVDGCAFSKKFLVKGKKLTEKEAVTSEIKRVWREQQTESVDTLSKLLPYIPLGNICRVISGNDLFVLTAEGVYLLLDRFRITAEEAQKILDYVYSACEQNGFASLSDVPLGDIKEENYELTPLAIYNAIYKCVLSDKFHLNGRILTVDKPELSVITILKQYIEGKERCSFDEIADKVVELTGTSNRQYAFQALYDDMVRIDTDQFVANGSVCFNIEETDNALASFVSDNFISIRDVTTFAMFPFPGVGWNHYLLESYCYKYSCKFSLHVLHFNNKNAGIIAEKDYNRQYQEMLAIALVRDNVELTIDDAGRYLFNAGYIAKSKYARLPEIIERAIEIRGGK